MAVSGIGGVVGEVKRGAERGGYLHCGPQHGGLQTAAGTEARFEAVHSVFRVHGDDMDGMRHQQTERVHHCRVHICTNIH